AAAQKRLNTAPDDAELQPLVRELSSLQAKSAELAAQLSERAAERDAVDLELTALGREHRRILESEADATKAQGRLSLASKARHALGDYLNALTIAKVGRLEHVAVECFNQLCRKDDLVRAMSIDPRTFLVTLKDGKGRDVRKSELSAGEKQLYAVAL